MHIKLCLLVLTLLLSCNPKPASKPAISTEVNTWQTTFPSAAPTTDAPSVITRTIIEDQDSNIWFATFAGVIQYDGQDFINRSKDISSGRFFGALEDRNGDLWFTSVGEGVYRYDGKSWQNFSTNDGLINDRVTNLYEDHQGSFWIGTEGGISRYDGTTFTNFTEADGLPNPDINTIIQDDSGVYWIASRGAAYTYDGEIFTVIENEEGQTFGNTRHIIKDRSGYMWLGGQFGLWRYDGEHFAQYTKDFVGYIYEDRMGNIWTSAEASAGLWQLSRFEAENLEDHTIPATVVKDGEGMLFGILEDANGRLWVGKLDGVFRYDGLVFEEFKE